MMKYYYLFGEGSKINQVLCAVLINLPVFAYGASIGWMSPMTLLLQSKDSPRETPLTATEVSWMAAVAYLVCVPSDYLMAFMGDRIGRKISLLLISATLCVTVTMMTNTLTLKTEKKYDSFLITITILTISTYLYLFSITVCLQPENGFILLFGIFIPLVSTLFVNVNVFIITGCWILKLSSLDTWAFILARAMVGVAMAGCYVICPIYTKEISEDCIRGFLGSVLMLFHTSGNLFLYVIGDFLRYRTILWICLSIPTFHLVLFLMMPESPSYLVKKGDEEEAARVLAWLRCRREDDPKVLSELDIMKKEQKKDETSSKFVFKAIISNKILFRVFRAALIIALSREVCGAIPVLNFAGEIFALASEGSVLVLTPNQQAMMLGVVQVLGSTVASSLVEKAGRKPLLFVTSLISGISMCLLASWFLAREYNVVGPAWLPIALLCICIFCDSSGLGPVSVIVTGEMFSYKYRGTVLATTMSAASFADFIQLLFFKPLANAVGIHVSFYFFGIVCILCAVYVLLVIPETKKRSLDEIYEDFKTKKEKKKERELELRRKEEEMYVY